MSVVFPVPEGPDTTIGKGWDALKSPSPILRKRAAFAQEPVQAASLDVLDLLS
jgi:hypothetical protein